MLAAFLPCTNSHWNQSFARIEKWGDDLALKSSLSLCHPTKCAWSFVWGRTYHPQKKAGKSIDGIAEIASLEAWGPVEEWNQQQNYDGQDRFSLFKSCFTKCFSKYWTLNMKYPIETNAESWNGTFVNSYLCKKASQREQVSYCMQ